MITATLEYWDRLRETKKYPNGGYYQDQSSSLIREETISGETDIEIFETFYKKNNQLRYCNGSYYQFQDPLWKLKYSEWLQSDDYNKKSFNLYYGGGVVD